MLRLDDLLRTVPAHQAAGRFGIEVLGLLLQPREPAGGEGARLCRAEDLSAPADIAALFETGAAPRVARSGLRDNVLVVRPRGEFFSTDRLALTRLEARGDEWSLDLEITRVENPNGLPAPRDLYVVLDIEAGGRRPRSLALRFGGRRLDPLGNETPLAVTSGEPLTIEFAD